MTKEEQQFNQWFDWYADGVKVFEEADMKQAYLQGRADLEKENAELKEKKIKGCYFGKDELGNDFFAKCDCVDHVLLSKKVKA